ncbi:E3 ubiquitin-protein ligase MARCH6 [Hypsibius exemplaris]|uniref:RING-type E3 ubiquitin transferase n=1 Tax=Hypsibius exemplaris TaxID=2072580 RepID=A0A9X6RJY4_HYPEX|nr:E3 ubiquitin-protein ligase MARCH6 [Hypsibius exemplaris]
MGEPERGGSAAPAWQEVDPMMDDICRVCRGEGSTEHPLFHPCRCSGSIRYVHEDCLMQWLHHSQRHYCELCQHRFTFRPIYAPDTPSRLPPYVLLRGVKQRTFKYAKKIVHGLLVLAVWLVFLPNYCARVESLLFREEGYASAVLRLLWIGNSPRPASDIGEGIIIMGLTMAILFSFVFLRDEIMHNGWNPGWIVLPDAPQPNPANNNNPLQPDAPPNEMPNDMPPLEDALLANAAVQADLPPPAQLDLDNAAAVDDEDEDAQAVGEAAGANGDANGDAGGVPFADDIALAHIVGLDGSYAFLEYAFWFSVLCGGFVTVFYLLPYTSGRLVVHDLGPIMVMLGVKVLNVAPISANISLNYSNMHQNLTNVLTNSPYRTAIYLYFGYCTFAICFSYTYDILGKDLFGFIRSIPYVRRFNTPAVKFGIGLFYLATKTGVLFFTEAVLFPTLFGGLADLSSMDIFNTTLADRLRIFNSAPGTFIFVHWIVGVLFISYFVWFVLLTKETLRPGLLWFVRSYQESNPFKELVMWPCGKSIRNLAFVLGLFLIIIGVTIYLPIRFLCRNFSGIFPYNLTQLEESPIGELTIQFAVLHYIGPSLFQQSTLRTFMKWLITTWSDTVGRLLGLRSYLLGDPAVPLIIPPNNNNNNAPNDGDLGVAHDQLDMMLVNSPNRPVQSYQRPPCFAARVVTLLLLLALTGCLISGALLTVPVLLGRLVLGFWFGARPVHDIYTLFTGLFTVAVVTKGARSITRQLRTRVQLRNVRWSLWVLVVARTAVASAMVLIWLPFLIGLTFEVTILKPVALLFDQSSIFQIYRCYVFGALIVKILLTICLVAVGENNPWKMALDQVYANGFRNMNLKLIFTAFVWPVSTPLLLYLSLPFFMARTYNMLALWNENPDVNDDKFFTAHTIEGVAHLMFVCSVAAILGLLASFGFCKQLHDQIRDELFLVGKRLVNYDNRATLVVPSTAV